MPSPSEVVGSLSLGEDEPLLWAGVPVQGLVLRDHDWFLIPFGLVWSGVPSAAAAFAVLYGEPVYALAPLALVPAGLYLLVGRFLVESRRRASTYYGITDRRAVVVSEWPERHVEWLSLRAAVPPSSGGGTRGTIVFGRDAPYPYGWLAGSGWPLVRSRVAARFALIENAGAVYELMRARR